MTPQEIHLFQEFCKNITFERNKKKYVLKKEFSQAFAQSNLTGLLAEDYFAVVPSPFVIRFAFDWKRDIYNEEGFWKDINHKWEEYCILKNLIRRGEFISLSNDEYKSVTRELFKGTQTNGLNLFDAMQYIKLYIEEREERKRKEKEAEDARLAAERQKHIENQKKHEEELRKKKEKEKQIGTISPVYTSSVIISNEDDEDDEDYLILNSAYSNKAVLRKGEIRIERGKDKNRITFSGEDGAEIIKTKLEYLCLKIDKTTGTLNLRICNDSNRGVKMIFPSGSNAVCANSKILMDFLFDKFGIKENKTKLSISSNESMNPNVLSYRIIGLKDA